MILVLLAGWVALLVKAVGKCLWELLLFSLVVSEGPFCVARNAGWAFEMGDSWLHL